MMVMELVVVLTTFKLVTSGVCGVEREREREKEREMGAFWNWCD